MRRNHGFDRRRLAAAVGSREHMYEVNSPQMCSWARDSGRAAGGQRCRRTKLIARGGIQFIGRILERSEACTTALKALRERTRWDAYMM